jgi:hypothetical protein
MSCRTLHTGAARAIAAVGAVLLFMCVASPARAQTGPDLLLKTWDKDERVEASVNGMFLENGHTKQEDADFRLSIYETEGRFRLIPGELASPRIGYEFSYFELHSNTRRLPDQLVNQSLAVAVPVGVYDKWLFGLSLGLGYAGEAPFGDGDAWYGRGTFVAFRELDKSSAIAFVLDYDGNRTILPDVPLPGFAYLKQLDPNVKVTVGLPVSSIEWKPIEHLELNLEYLLPYDVSARVGYEFAPGLTAYGLLGQRRDAWHWDALKNNNDRLFFQQQRAELGLTWKPCPNAGLTAAVGYAWGGEFTKGFDTRDDDLVTKISDGPYARLELSIHF